MISSITFKLIYGLLSFYARWIDVICVLSAWNRIRGINWYIGLEDEVINIVGRKARNLRFKFFSDKNFSLEIMLNNSHVTEKYPEIFAIMTT